MRAQRRCPDGIPPAKIRYPRFPISSLSPRPSHYSPGEMALSDQRRSADQPEPLLANGLQAPIRRGLEGKTRDTLTERRLHGKIARKGEKAPIQAGQRWHVERTNAWHNSFNRPQRCYERREVVVEAFFDIADTIITVRSLIRRAWTTHRWDTRPPRRP
jgi:hypothetical protein